MRMAALILLARAQHEQAAGIHLPGAGGAFQPPRARCGERERIGRGPLGRDRAIIRRVLENIHRDGAGAGQRAVRSPANPMRPCPDLPYTDWKSWSLAGRATSPASARLPIRTAGAASPKTPDCGQRSNSSAYGRAARADATPVSSGSRTPNSVAARGLSRGLPPNQAARHAFLELLDHSSSCGL